MGRKTRSSQPLRARTKQEKLLKNFGSTYMFST
ncbi:hypothetical protein CCACVL1_01792, partial [Corchorus capsularis]